MFNIPSTIGKYRICYGAPIQESSFDYETSKLGPYTFPIHFECYQETYGERGYSDWQFYEVFKELPDVLAIFVVNNSFFCCLHQLGLVSYQPFLQDDQRAIKALPVVPKYTPVPIPKVYKHIGFMKTYNQNMNVSAPPDYLVMNEQTGEVPYVKGTVTGTPLVNPQFSMYKELLKTNHNAVYFDMDKHCLVYLD